MDTLTLARSFASLLLDTAAKGTALLLLAALAAWLCRRSSAALRHSIWCMTMGGLLILPVASWALPAWQIPILPPEPLPSPVAEVVRLPAFTPQGATGEGFDSPVPRHSTAAPTVFGQDMLHDTGGPKRPPVAPSAPPVIEPVPAPVPALVAPAAEPWTTIEWTSLLVSAGWSLGVSLFGILLLVGLWRTVKLRRTSLAVSDGEWPGMLVELRQRLGLSRSVELREHAESVVPLTWGIWRPVVLLPKLARAWDEPMRRAVLLHELAHVQRGDVACQVLGRMTCVLYWFHPLAWFALRQLRQEREQACDDAVVGTGEKASDYAEQLLQVARLCCAPRGLSLGVSMAEGSSLERRVKSLFDSARSHGPLTRRVALALFAIGGAILAGLAPIEPTASQAEPPVVEAVEKENVVANPPIETQERILEGDAARQQMELLKPVFGEAKRGIQLGLAVGSLERTFPQGGRIPLWLFYRNLGNKELTFHISQDFMNDPVTVTDANGNRVHVNFVMHWMFIAPLKITLQPGEVWCIATPGLYLGDRMPSIKPVAGRYKLTYPQGIWDVNTTPRLNTDLPFLPTGTPDISGLLKADPKQPASNALVGQVVETPNWSESLTTGEIEFEIAPGKNGQLDARVLADADIEAQTGKQTPSQSAVAQPKVIELLSRFRESRQRLEPLHVQMRHIEEYTDAFRAHHRIQAERQELVVKAIQKMSTEDFKKANPHLGPGISADYVRLSIKDSYDTNRSFATMQNQSVSDVELFQKGTAYQIRTRRNSLDDSPDPMSFPVEALTAGNLGTTYKGIRFYSWAPQTTPSGMIVHGSQPQHRQITSKPYHTNGANPIPAFSNFVSTRSHDWHPIDAFFFQPPENYRVIGAEMIDGRETVIVEVPVATSDSQGFANEKGESYQLKEVHYHRAWLDPARGSLPVRLLIWHGNEKTDFATHVSQPPRNVMTTQRLTEVVPGGWYPTLTTLDKYDRDEEKMPKAPPNGQGAERDKYLEDIAKVPLVVYERETWKCEFVEVPRTLTDEFFVLPTPAGAKIIDRDREDLIDDYSLGLPVNEFSEVGAFLGKAWLLGPLSVMPDLSKDGGVGEVTQKAPMPVGQNEDTPKADADVDLDKVVWWGEAVDGLEPGFWLTKSEDPRNLRIPMDSLVSYRVVVRNTTDKEIEFLVRMLPFDGLDAPYLIPSDKLDVKGRIAPPQPAKEFQARGAANVLKGINPAYLITLAAGESALIPGEYGLFVGEAPDEHYPQIANFVPGTHWIVQPLLVHPLADTERAELNPLLGEFQVTTMDRSGKTRQEPVVRVGAPDDSKGKFAHAKYHLEVGTLNAEAHRNAEKANWGEIEKGMQCGIRLLNPQPSYKIGDTLEAEVLWRNTTAAVISTTRPRTLDLYPIIQDAQGNAKLIDFGARFDLLPGNYDYQPGEVVSLGVSKITLVAEGTPGSKSNKEPGQITLEPGKYQLIGNGGVGNINPRSGKLEFTVVGDTVSQQEPKPAAPGTAENPSTLITGRVLNQGQQPLAGATVALSEFASRDGVEQEETLATGQTDESGAFQIEVASSLLSNKTSHSTLVLWGWSRDVRQEGFGYVLFQPDGNHQLDVTIFAPRDAAVRVVNGDGTPVQGTVTEVKCDAMLPDALRQKVLSQSEFLERFTLHGFPWNTDDSTAQFSNVRCGVYFDVPGRGQHNFTWKPKPAKSGPATLTVPKPVTYRGQLTTPDRQPLPKDLGQVRISLKINFQDKSLNQGWYFHDAGTVLCDSAGRFEIAGIEPLKATGVHLEANLGEIKGWTWRKVQIPQLKPSTDGIIDVELPLVRTQTVRGQLVSTKGEPLAGIELSVTHGNVSEEARSDSGTTSSAERNEKFQTDSEGRFSVEVIPGVIKVSKSISPGSNISTALPWPESLPIVRGIGKLQIDEGESPLDLPALPITVLSGQVVDDQMKPYRGMIVAQGENPNHSHGIGFSAADGSFRIEATGEPTEFQVISMENANQIPFGKQNTDTVIKSRDPLVLQVVPRAEAAADAVPPKEPPAAVPALPKEERASTPNMITGQIVNDKKDPLSGAEVVLVLEVDNNDSTKPGRVAAQATTDDEGRYVLTLPPEVATSKRFGAVWARAKGHTMARGHWSSVIPALSNRRDQLTLTATTGTKVQVLDQAGKPLEGVRLRASRVGIPEGVGYEPPSGWEDQLSATTDTRGEATLIAVVPDSVQGLSLQPPGAVAELQFGTNYFLNIRPRSEGRHFSFRLPETGSVDGQLNVAEGQRLPEGLTLEVRSCSLELPQFDGVVRVPVAADGTFRIALIPTGQLIVPPFLPEDQPLRAVVPPHVEVKAGKTAKLEISVAPGVRVQGRVIRSDLKTGFANYPVTVIYGQSITNRRVDFDWQKFELKTNEEGVFKCILPPGPIEVQAATHVDGYQRTSSWLPEGKRGMWGGTRFTVPKRESIELEPIELTKSISIQGQLIDQNKAVVEGWEVYGYPKVPGFEPSSTMNSFAGVHTMKDGHFEGRYPQSYPPVRWEVSHRVWKTKYEFDDIKYRAEVVQKEPLILRVDTTKPMDD